MTRDVEILPTSTNAEVRAAIMAAYPTLGAGLDWTFMTSPEALLRTAPVALVGLNPGGGEGQYSTVWDVPQGSDYQVSDWGLGHGAGKAPLQIQVQELCKVADVDITNLFSAQFLPFRSPSWSALPRPAEALLFARSLWVWVLANSRFKTCFTLGHLAGVHLANLMAASEIDPGHRVTVDWGRQQLRRYRAADGRRIVSLPHLSRFQLFAGDKADERRRIVRAALDF